MMTKRAFNLLSYLAVGLGSIGLAIVVSSMFLTPSYSKTEEPETFEMPPPPPPAENLGAQEQIQGEAVKPTETSDQQDTENIEDLIGFLEPFEYDGKGRRDPFKPYRILEELKEGEMKGPLLPLQRFVLEEIRLAGIIWDVDEPKAMFIDPKGQTHTIGLNDRIGRNNGYIATIREGEVVVVETLKVRGEIIYNTKIIKMDR